MIPLSLFLVIWLVLIGIYAIVALITIVQMTRFAISGSVATLVILLYVVVAGLALGGTAMYLFGIDWNTTIEFGGTFLPDALTS